MATKLKRDINKPIELEVLKQNAQLGNVPNVTTNNQTPTWSIASALNNIKSGETLSVIMGKVSKAIDSIMLHINNKSNPHGVTKSQIGLSNVENKSSATIRGELTKDNVTKALGYTPPTTNTTYGVATSSSLGLVKSGTDITVDASGNVSVNNNSHTHTKSNITDFPSSMPASDVYSWAKQSSKPTYTKAEIGLGNVDNTADRNKSVNYANSAGSVYEANIKWGGKNFAGDYGCIDACMIPELGANRFAFLNTEGITIEYSRDGGNTWLDYGADNYTKSALFSTGTSCRVGKADSSNPATSNYKLRVTVDTGKSHIYTVLNKFCIYVSTSGSSGCTCTIERALESTPNEYTQVVSKVPISGWSGYNIINTSNIVTYGNTASTQYGRIRFIFETTGGDTSKYIGLNIQNIMAFGGVGWSTPSNMAKNGHLYSYDTSQNAVFPANVRATRFEGAIKDMNGDRNLGLSYSGSDVNNPSYFAVWSTDGNQVRTISKANAKVALGLDKVNNTADSSKSVNYANTSGKANKVNTIQGTADLYRNVFFADSAGVDTLGYNSAIQANPVGGILKATRFEGKADSAKSADSVAWGNVSGKPTIPTKTSQLTNDSGYLTSHQSLANYALKSQIPTKVSQLTNDKGYLTSHQSLANYYTKEQTYSQGEINNKLATKLNAKAEDTRNTNETPQWYFNHYGYERAFEFKSCSVIELPLVNTVLFCNLETLCSWGNDSGGYPIQIATPNNNPIFVRYGTSATTWSEWQKIYSTEFKPTKTDVGLGNVDNTSDSQKSVKYATSAGSAKASDVYAWAKASTKPTYTAKEVGALPSSTTLANLSGDSTHRTVTDAEKTKWNNKSDFSGNYNDLTNKPTIPSGVVVVDNLTSTSTTSSLSAKQGKVLNEKIGHKTILSKSQPTNQTTGDTWYQII